MLFWNLNHDFPNKTNNYFDTLLDLGFYLISLGTIETHHFSKES